MSQLFSNTSSGLAGVTLFEYTNEEDFIESLLDTRLSAYYTKTQTDNFYFRINAIQPLNMNGFRITNINPPVDVSDAVNLGTLQNAIQNIDVSLSLQDVYEIGNTIDLSQGSFLINRANGENLIDVSADFIQIGHMYIDTVNNRTGFGVIPTEDFQIDGNIQLDSGKANKISFYDTKEDNEHAHITAKDCDGVDTGRLEFFTKDGAGQSTLNTTMTCDNRVIINREAYADTSGVHLDVSGAIYTNTDIYENGSKLMDTYARLNSANTFTGKIYINNNDDVNLNANSGSLVIGSKAGSNIGIDGNEIQARNASAKSILYLNNEGGDVRLSGSKHTFKDDGRLGVNTTSPSASYILDVSGSANATTLYENGTAISDKYVNATGDTMTGSLTFNTGTSEKIRLQSANSIADMWMTSYDESGNRLWIVNMGDRSHGNEFAIYSQATKKYEMRIDVSGRFGFGEAPNSNYKMIVNGNMSATNLYEGATAISAKYAPISHTHTTSDITNLSSYTGFDARYLQSVPAEYLTQTEGDARYSQLGHTHTSDITNLSSYTGFTNYYDKTTSDGRYLNATGDTLTGKLQMNAFGTNGYIHFDAGYGISISPQYAGGTFPAVAQASGSLKILDKDDVVKITLDTSGGSVDATEFIENGTALEDKYVLKGGDSMTGDLIFSNEENIVRRFVSEADTTDYFEEREDKIIRYADTDYVNSGSGPLLGNTHEIVMGYTVNQLTLPYGASGGWAVKDHMMKFNVYNGYGSSGSLTNVMNLLGSGNVGIGTTTPSYELDVNGSANATTLYEDGTALSSKYLQLSGGTLTGPLTIDGGDDVLIMLGDGEYDDKILQIRNSNAGIQFGLNDNFDNGYGIIHAGTVKGIGFVVNGTTSETGFKNIQKSDLDMVISPDGDVGIGTGSPSAKLDVEVESNNDGLEIQYLGTAGEDIGGAINFFTNDITSGTPRSGTGTARIKCGKLNNINADDSVYLSFSTRENDSPLTEHLRITDVGNVGIGKTNPFYKLEVNGDMRISTSQGQDTDRYLYIQSSDANDYTPFDTKLGGIYFQHLDTDNVLSNFGLIAIHNTNTSGHLNPATSNNMSDMTFSVQQNGVLATAMRIRNNGNVGIGNNLNSGNITTKLYIKGDDDMLRLEGVDNPYISFANSSTRTWVLGTISSGNDNFYLGRASGTGDTLIGITSAGGSAGGNVGIGTTSPAQKLEVNGNILQKVSSGYVANFIECGANSFCYYRYSANGTSLFQTTCIATTTNSEYWTLYGSRDAVEILRASRNGGLRFSQYLTNGTVQTTNSNGTIIVSSDRRLKTNINYQTNTQQALEEVNKWKPAIYDWKESGDTDLGFIAQDLETSGSLTAMAVDGKKYEYDFQYEYDMEDKDVELLDASGNPILDESGNPMMETIQVKADMPSDRPVLDASGNPVLNYDKPRYRGVTDRSLIAIQTLAIQELTQRLDNSERHALHERIQTLENENAKLRQEFEDYKLSIDALIEQKIRSIKWNL